MMIRLRISKRSMPTYVLIALNVIVYAYTSIIGGSFIKTSEDVLVEYGQFNFRVMNGWYWQLLTSMFVHVSIMHLLGNMFFLLLFGLRAEELLNVKEYLLIYFFSGLAGSLLTLLLGPNVVSAGASGAVFGIFGAVTIYIRRAIGQSIISALLFSFFLLVITSGFGVNVFAHLGGLIVGLLVGYRLAATRRLRTTYAFKYGYSS